MPAISSIPVGFISGSADGEEKAFVEGLANQLEAELKGPIGEGHQIWWKAGGGLPDDEPLVQGIIASADFIVLLVTPNYLRSDYTRQQLRSILMRDDASNSFVFPIHWIDSFSAGDSDLLIKELRKRECFDWRDLRQEPFDSPRVREAIAALAQRIRSALATRNASSSSALEGPLAVERLRLENFRCFQDLDLHFKPLPPFRDSSTLGGDWSCVAGINGSGKSCILQAISIALLGGMATEQGGALLARMRRVGMSPDEWTSITLTFSRGGTTGPSIAVQIDERGSIKRNSDPPVATALVLGYGATRNLGEEADSPFNALSPEVQAVIGVFRPLAQLASADVLLSDRRRSPHLLPLFSRLIQEVFEDDLTVEERLDSPALHFKVSGRDAIEANDLPDGFRSSSAWLADLCATWCTRQPEAAATHDPAQIEAIVLIDEIDLHLHPGLQRELVPRLRKALPKIQWIVTTHSPLVLANFDSSEIIALDRDAEGQVRRLDRQILSFTSDEIYQWLMHTRPTGAAIEQMIAAGDRDPATKEKVAELLRTTPQSTPAEAREQVAEFRRILESLKR